jgi:arabinogalactan endo-1,4-beta-galactosidase
MAYRLNFIKGNYKCMKNYKKFLHGKVFIVAGIGIALCLVLLIDSQLLLAVSRRQGATAVKKKKIGKMLGADISFLPQLESRGIKFSENGVEKDAMQILKEHKVNYIRLRIFNDPAADSGYSPKKGFCDLEHTKQMAKRVKAAGMKFLLDFHYSDTWADPGKQFRPSAWKGYDFIKTQESIRTYTKEVLLSLKEQGTLPDMVQVGNEINHGMIWPDGNARNMDTLTAFIKAGIEGINDVDPSINIMLHIACGGQNSESRYFLDNMIAHGVDFDLIGESYYPKWHGTLEDLKNNLTDLSARYKQDLIVVEYSEHKREVNDIVFNLPDGKGKGTCIWEPLNTWEFFINKDGKTNDLINIYGDVAKKYSIK